MVLGQYRAICDGTCSVQGGTGRYFWYWVSRRRYWVSMERNWLIGDGTGSEEGGTG